MIRDSFAPVAALPDRHLRPFGSRKVWSARTVVPEPTWTMRPRIGFVAAVMLAMVYISLVAYRPITASLMQGIAISEDSADAGIWQYLREALLICLVLVLVNGLVLHLKAHSAKVLIERGVVLGLLYLCAVVAVTLLHHGPGLALFGLRYLCIAALLVLLTHYSRADRQLLTTTLAKWLKPFVLIQAALAFHQVVAAPPVYGANFLGSRAWGSYPYPNNLGLTMLGVALMFMIGKPKNWAAWTALTFVLAMTTGCRLAILGILLLAALHLIRRSDIRTVMLAPVLVLGAGAYWWASQAGVSGRELGGREARLDVWHRLLQVMHTPLDWLFGAGMGTGSNAAIVAGADTRFTDSAVLGVLLSFGLIGLVLSVHLGYRIFRISDPASRFFVWPSVLLALLVFNALEVSPINILLAVALSTVVKECAHGRPTDHFGRIPPPRRAMAERA